MKIFDIKKYVGQRRKDGHAEEEIVKALLNWANRCDGRIATQMPDNSGLLHITGTDKTAVPEWCREV